MGVMRCIDIRVSPYNHMRIIEIIQHICSGDLLPLEEYEEYFYLATNDDWETSNDLNEVLTIIDKKQDLKENIGFELKLKNSEYIIVLNLFEYPKGWGHFFDFSFNLAAAKRIKGLERYSDFSFYLEKVVPRIEEIAQIGFIECEDLDSC